MASRLSWTRKGPSDIVGRETPNVFGTNLDELYDGFDSDHDPANGQHDVEPIAYGGGYVRFEASGTPPTYTLIEKYGIVDSITPVSTGIVTVTLAFGDWSQYSQMADDGSGNYYYKVIVQAIGSAVSRTLYGTTLAATSFRVTLDEGETAADGDFIIEVFGRLAA